MKIEFTFPDLGCELYDHQTKIAYIFCMKKDDAQYVIMDIERYINHAWLHYLIQKFCGTKVSLKFDKISTKVTKWDIETYRILY